MFWNWMNYGHLSVCVKTNAGFGLFYADEHVRWLLLSLAIVAQRLVKNFGGVFLFPIEVVTAIAISGMPTRRFFQKKRIVALAKTVDKQIMLNVGTVSYAKG